MVYAPIILKPSHGAIGIKHIVDYQGDSLHFLEQLFFSLGSSVELPVRMSINMPYLPKEGAETSSPLRILSHTKNPGLYGDL